MHQLKESKFKNPSNINARNLKYNQLTNKMIVIYKNSQIMKLSRVNNINYLFKICKSKTPYKKKNSDNKSIYQRRRLNIKAKKFNTFRIRLINLKRRLNSSKIRQKNLINRRSCFKINFNNKPLCQKISLDNTK